MSVRPKDVHVKDVSIFQWIELNGLKTSVQILIEHIFGF